MWSLRVHVAPFDPRARTEPNLSTGWIKQFRAMSTWRILNKGEQHVHVISSLFWKDTYMIKHFCFVFSAYKLGHSFVQNSPYCTWVTCRLLTTAYPDKILCTSPTSSYISSLCSPTSGKAINIGSHSWFIAFELLVFTQVLFTFLSPNDHLLFIQVLAKLQSFPWSLHETFPPLVTLFYITLSFIMIIITYNYHY